MTNGEALEVRGLTAGSGALAVVHNVAFHVSRGEIVRLIGRNGAGKTTTLMAIAGFLGRYGGEVLVDGIALKGPAYRRGREKIGIVLEGRSIFPSLTVKENLELAEADLAEALDLFPELQSKLALRAGLLSGGEGANAGLGQGGMSASSGPLDRRALFRLGARPPAKGSSTGSDPSQRPARQECCLWNSTSTTPKPWSIGP